MNFGEKCHEEFKFIGAQTAGGPTRELIQETLAGTCHKVLRQGPKVRDSGMDDYGRRLTRAAAQFFRFFVPVSAARHG